MQTERAEVVVDGEAHGQFQPVAQGETLVYSRKAERLLSEDERAEIWLLTLYSKNERATVPAHELRLIKEAIERERQSEDE